MIVIPEWNVFRNSDFTKVKQLFNYAVIFDGKNHCNTL